MAPQTQISEVGQTTPHFFTVINSAVINGGRLSMPKKFVRSFFNEKHQLATLEVLDGIVWNVHLETTSNNVWFGKGLEAFISHYYISPGYFLIFRYEGNAHFSVIICNDKTFTEIDYPPKYVDLTTPHVHPRRQTQNKDIFMNPPRNQITLVIGLRAAAAEVDNVKPPKRTRTIVLAHQAGKTIVHDVDPPKKERTIIVALPAQATKS